VRYSSGMRCVLGFDGSSTKMDCVLMDESGAVLARTQSGPSNPVLVGIEGAVEAVVAAADEALLLSGAAVTDIRIVVGEIAGAGTHRNSWQIHTYLITKFTHAEVLIHSDGEFTVAPNARNETMKTPLAEYAAQVALELLRAQDATKEN
jgi:N-acetylglucosamine kinase-like BadF-type ATPase